MHQHLHRVVRKAHVTHGSVDLAIAMQNHIHWCSSERWKAATETLHLKARNFIETSEEQLAKDISHN